MKKRIAKILCITPVVVWLGLVAYGYFKYELNNREKEVVCGYVQQLEPYQKLAGSKSNIRTENALIGQVHFDNYGSRVLQLPLDYTFDGVGKQYCTYLKHVDSSVKTPNSWECFLLLSFAFITAVLITCGGMAFFNLVCHAYGDEEEVSTR